MARNRQYWIDEVEARIPHEKHIVERNRAITARYATWYLEHPELFKWAGMAAFASRQVGLALAAAELMIVPGRFRSSGAKESGRTGASDPGELLRQAAGALLYLPSLMHSFAADRLLFLRDLDKIRHGNNGIFFDIGWAHAAFLEGGIGEVERNIEPGEEEYMLRGFRMIDEGRRLLANGSREVVPSTLIREGNELLLRHEQLRTLQPVFDSLTLQGRVLASFGSELDFPEPAEGLPAMKPSFSTHVGYLETFVGWRSVADPGHRWKWIEESVLPAWERLDNSFGEGSPLKRQLESYAALEPALEHQVTAFARKLFGFEAS
ncbi:MAG: hypothetical protein HGB20_10840 [Chlorobiaceae bacterium]|nr:hypothetical protein [Chlorobiaceae bacterium]